MTNSLHWEWSGNTGPRGNPREAVALFDTETDLQEAVDDLEIHGFSNAAISRPPPMNEVSEILHHSIHHMKELEDDSHVPRKAYVDSNSRTSGIMVTIVIPIYVLLLAGLVIAVGHSMTLPQTVGMVIGFGIVGAGLGGYYAHRASARNRTRVDTEKGLGGLLLWVRTGNSDQETRALEILSRHAGRDVHMHGPAQVI